MPSVRDQLKRVVRLAGGWRCARSGDAAAIIGQRRDSGGKKIDARAMTEVVSDALVKRRAIVLGTCGSGTVGRGFRRRRQRTARAQRKSTGMVLALDRFEMSSPGLALVQPDEHAAPLG